MLRVSFAKVAEYQKRGLVHFYAVIRLDGPDGSTQPPPPSATVTMLADAIRAAAARVSVNVVSAAVGERELAWGEQLDVREIAAFGTDAELTDHAVAAYVAKYATKSADSSGALDRALFCRPCQGRGMTLTVPRNPTPVHRLRWHRTGPAAAPPRRRTPRAADDPHLLGAGQAPGVRRPQALEVGAHEALEVGAHARLPEPLLQQVPLLLRRPRPTARRPPRLAHRTGPHTHAACPSTTLVIGPWAYPGSGYSPDAKLLAATVWHRRELEWQFTAEGGC